MGRFTSWSIWRIPPFAITTILLVDLAATLLPASIPERITSNDVYIGSLLAALSISYSALTCAWERARRAAWESTRQVSLHYRNLLSVWNLVAAFTLPVSVAALVVVVGAVAEWPARTISGKAQPFRYVYSCAGAVIAATTTHLAITSGLPYGTNVVSAAAVFMAVGILPVVLAEVAVGKRQGFGRYLRWETHRLEFYTVLFGLAQVFLLRIHLDAMIWMSLPAAILLQRQTTKSDLQDVADSGIQPMREEAWLVVAQEVIRACAVGAIMRIDTTDRAAVSYLARYKAGCDAIGSVGQSGLAVLLTQCPGENADALATRMRAILHREGVAAAVAVAAKPRDGQSLDDLLAVSEAELIARVAASRSAKSDIPEA